MKSDQVEILRVCRVHWGNTAYAFTAKSDQRECRNEALLVRQLKRTGCYDRGGFLGDTLDRVRKYGVNAQELVTTSSTRLLMTT